MLGRRLSGVAEPGEAAGGSRWFAVFTQPHREAAALRHLRNQGYTAWLPCRLRTVRHARRAETAARALFPRYLFVRFDPEHDSWRSINGTVGVVHLVSFGDAPTPVPEGVVETLQDMCDSSGVLQFGSRIQPGQAVRLSAGPFAEELGALERLDGADAVRVLLNIMGRQVTVKVRRRNLLPAG